MDVQTQLDAFFTEVCDIWHTLAITWSDCLFEWEYGPWLLAQQADLQVGDVSPTL